jgi:Protein involved in cellulose biosynthesis (CelD)
MRRCHIQVVPTVIRSLEISGDNSNWIVQFQPLTSVTHHLVDRWRELSAKSIDRNPFLHPDFVLPSRQVMDAADHVQLCTVETAVGDLRLVTLLSRVRASSLIPFPHWMDGMTVYQFQGGMLVHPEDPLGSISAFLHHCRNSEHRHGIKLRSVNVESPVARHLYIAATLAGFQIQLRNRWPRASLDFNQWDRGRPIEEMFSKNRRKSLKKARSRFEQCGELHFRVIDQGDDVIPASERFLDLEQRGWKKAAGTAIACNELHRRFYQQMVQAFAAQRKILFAELCLGNEVIASSCNLIDGETLFAFKIGWDSAYRDYCPGILVEVELCRYVAAHRPDITLLNSCSQAGSYLDSLWPHHIPMGNVVLTHSHRASLFSGFERTLRTAKRMLWPTGAASQP